MAIEAALHAELTSAVRRRDAPVVAVLRAALAALANAEAPTPATVPGTSPTDSIHVAGATPGLRATEGQPRTLTEQDQRSIVTNEMAELADRVDRLTRLCRRDEADGVRRGLHVLRRVLDSPA